MHEDREDSRASRSSVPPTGGGRPSPRRCDEGESAPELDPEGHLRKPRGDDDKGGLEAPARNLRRLVSPRTPTLTETLVIHRGGPVSGCRGLNRSWAGTEPERLGAKPFAPRRVKDDSR